MLWFITLLLTSLGFFLSLWIILPAPIFSLLPFGVVAPEISPWLVSLNGNALILSVTHLEQGSLSVIVLIGSLSAFCLSLLPLIQFSATNRSFAAEMEAKLGKDYLSKISPEMQLRMRPQPLILADVFRGIPRSEIRIERNIIFASPDNIDLKLNIYRPLSRGIYPAIVIIYGGAWKGGKPSNDEAFSCYMAHQGYSAIAIDYRHAPQYKYPTQIQDVTAALKYIKNHAEQLEVDLERVGIMGRSAGGHLASIAGYQRQIIDFKAVVNYYSPVSLREGYYDLPFPDPIKIRKILHEFLGGNPEELPLLYHQASPNSYIESELPPSLSIYAGRDKIVQAKFGRSLHQELQATNNLSVYLQIPWAEHAFDAVFFGVSNQLALYYTERFLAWSLL